jgi:hypothetical protein
MFNHLKVFELKSELVKRNLSQEGLKKALIKRLEDFEHNVVLETVEEEASEPVIGIHKYIKIINFFY